MRNERDRRHRDTERAWDVVARAKYRREFDQHVELLRSGKSALLDVEAAALGELLSGAHVVQFQCSHGLDALGLLNAGASSVLGIDISSEMISQAKAKAATLGVRTATFLHSDVTCLPTDLDGTADLVYTGRGSLPWILDLGMWSESVARVLKPGGHILVFRSCVRMQTVRQVPMLNSKGVSQADSMIGAQHIQGSIGGLMVLTGNVSGQDRELLLDPAPPRLDVHVEISPETASTTSVLRVVVFVTNAEDHPVNLGFLSEHVIGVRIRAPSGKEVKLVGGSRIYDPFRGQLARHFVSLDPDSSLVDTFRVAMPFAVGAPGELVWVAESDTLELGTYVVEGGLSGRLHTEQPWAADEFLLR